MLLSLSEFGTKISNVLASFGIADFLDICLVAFVIYNAIKLLRETRAFQLIRGLLFCVIVYGLVNLINMQASTYLFKTIFSNIILVLIILFQPELRHALETAGRSGLTKLNLLPAKRNDHLEREENINTMLKGFVSACVDMSEKKIGSLTVFERNTLLGEIIGTGTIIDAAPNMQMFENVFFPNSPLHDGAAIVRNCRIYAAGCILPLTQNNNLNKELGTRHRAAIGMSEQSDAVIIVTSEESGYISIAYKGVLKRDITSAELMTLLREYLINADKSGSGDNDKPNILKTIKKHFGGLKK